MSTINWKPVFRMFMPSGTQQAEYSLRMLLLKWASLQRRMLQAQTKRLTYIPSCIYTIPEISSVGLTEEKAAEAGYDPIVGIFPLSACGKAVAVGEDEGFFKIVADKSSRKVLGAHLVGKSATELVAEICAYLKMGATIDDITDTIHAHPTIAEAIAEAARNIDGMTIHMPNKK